MDETPPATEPAARPGLFGQLARWFGRLPGIAKAVAAVAPVCVMVLLGAIAVWQDQSRRQIGIEVSPNADQALLAAGLDLDLRQALIDRLNDRLRGVEAVAATSGLVKPMDTDPQAPISFAAFGSKLSTDQVAAIARYVRGSPRPTQVSFGLLCGTQACTEGQALTGATRLVVRLQTRTGVQRSSYPLAPGRGLGHAVRAAVDRTADALLEQTEPLVAGIYDINAAQTALFDDEKQRDIDAASGVADALRGGKPGEACIAGIVTAAGLLMRGQLEDGLRALLGAAPGDDRGDDRGDNRGDDRVCRLRIASQTASLLALAAGCAPDASMRARSFAQLSTVVAAMPALVRGAPRALADRVPGSRMLLAAARFMQDIEDGARGAMCSGTANSAAGRSAALAQLMTGLLAEIRRDMPPNGAPQQERQVIDFLALASEDGVHREDLASRYTVITGVLGLVRDYAPAARQPRHLLMVQGALAMDAVRLARDAMTTLTQADKVSTLVGIGVDPAAAADADGLLLGAAQTNLGVARAAFAAAAGAHTATRLEEPAPDIAPLVLLGDTLAVAGDAAGASRAYAMGVDAFTADGAPVDELGELAQAASHWAILRAAAGGCRADALPDGQWRARWSKLGAGGQSACALQQADPAGDRSIFSIIRPLVADVLDHCRPGAGVASADPQAGGIARLALADCERVHGTGNTALLRAFASQDSTAVEADLAQALGQGRP